MILWVSQISPCAHHGCVAAPRPDLPGMRFWNQYRSNSCPNFPGGRPRRGGLPLEGRESEAYRCYAETWWGRMGHIASPQPPTPQKRGKREGKEKRGLARQQELVYRESWNLETLSETSVRWASPATERAVGWGQVKPMLNLGKQPIGVDLVESMVISKGPDRRWIPRA